MIACKSQTLPSSLTGLLENLAHCGRVILAASVFWALSSIGERVAAEEVKILPLQSPDATVSETLKFKFRDQRIQPARDKYAEARRDEERKLKDYNAALDELAGLLEKEKAERDALKREMTRVAQQIENIRSGRISGGTNGAAPITEIISVTIPPVISINVTVSGRTLSDQIKDARKKLAKRKGDLDRAQAVTLQRFEEYVFIILANPPIYVNKIEVKKSKRGAVKPDVFYEASWIEDPERGSSSVVEACGAEKMANASCQLGLKLDADKLQKRLELEILSLQSQLQRSAKAREEIARTRLLPLSDEIQRQAANYGDNLLLAVGLPVVIELVSSIATVPLDGGATAVSTLLSNLSTTTARQSLPKLLKSSGELTGKQIAFVGGESLKIYLSKQFGGYAGDTMEARNPKAFGLAHSAPSSVLGDLAEEGFGTVADAVAWEAISEKLTAGAPLAPRSATSAAAGLTTNVGVAAATALTKAAVAHIFGSLADHAFAQFSAKMIEHRIITVMLNESLEQDWKRKLELDRLRAFAVSLKARASMKPAGLKLEVRQKAGIKWDDTFDKVHFVVTFSEPVGRTPVLRIDSAVPQEVTLKQEGPSGTTWSASSRIHLPEPGTTQWPLSVSFSGDGQPNADLDHVPRTHPTFSFKKGDVEPEWHFVETEAEEPDRFVLPLTPVIVGDWRSPGGGILEVRAITYGEYCARWKQVSKRGLEVGFRDGHIAMQQIRVYGTEAVANMVFRYPETKEGAKNFCEKGPVWKDVDLTLKEDSSQLSGHYKDRVLKVEGSKCVIENIPRSFSFTRIAEPAPIRDADIASPPTEEQAKRLKLPDRSKLWDACPF